MSLRAYLNLLLIRYVVVAYEDDKIEEFVILTLPWYDKKTTFNRGKIVWSKVHD